MRVKVEGSIVEKTKPCKTNYTHETYSMILNNLTPMRSERLHEKVKRFRFLTFTNIYIMENKVHFYVAGEDNLMKDFIQHIMFNQMIRIDDMVINIKSISPLPNLPTKDIYKFKTKLVINVNKNGKTQLCEDMDIVKERVIKNTLSKAKTLGIDGKIRDIVIHNPKHNIEKYKNGHINSWRCIVEMDCDYDIANMVYNVGLGENTASGHGFLWEA